MPAARASYRVQDLWLAALAVPHNLKIRTLNAKDFQDIPGLTVLTLPARPAR